MERSFSGEFSWSQVDSSSFKLESALRSRSQTGVSQLSELEQTLSWLDVDELDVVT